MILIFLPYIIMTVERKKGEIVEINERYSDWNRRKIEVWKNSCKELKKIKSWNIRLF